MKTIGRTRLTPKVALAIARLTALNASMKLNDMASINPSGSVAVDARTTQEREILRQHRDRARYELVEALRPTLERKYLEAAELIVEVLSNWYIVITRPRTHHTCVYLPASSLSQIPPEQLRKLKNPRPADESDWAYLEASLPILLGL